MKRLAVILSIFAVAFHAQAALILGSLSGGATKDLSPEILLDTYTDSGGHLVIAQVRLADLNAAAALITLRFEHTTAADVILAYKADISSDAKFADANTRYGYRMSNSVYLADGEKLKVYGTSTNTSDVASYTITVLDANYSASLIGTPVPLDSGTATLAGMLTKMADDNGGASYNAETDSLNKLSDTLGSPMQAGTVALTGDYDAAKTAAQPGDAMTLTGDYDAAKSAAQPGDEMNLVDAPNGTAVTAIQSGLATPTNITAASGVVLAADQHVIVDSGTVDTVTNPVTATGGDWAKAGDEMALTVDYDTAKTAATQGSVDGVVSVLGAIAGAGWTDETLVAIMAAIESAKTSADAAARPGDKMDLVNSPNSTAMSAMATAFWNQLATACETVGSLGRKIRLFLNENRRGPDL